MSLKFFFLIYQDNKKNMNAKESNLIHLNYNKNHILETNSVLLDN